MNLKKTTAKFLLILILISCGNSKEIHPKIPEPSTDVNSQKEKILIWRVKEKTCGNQQQPLLGVEKFQLDSGHLAHLFLLSQNEKQICDRVQIFNRSILQAGNENGTSDEAAVLSAQVMRTVCKDNASGANISDEINTFTALLQTWVIRTTGTIGTADLTGSPFCEGNILHFVLNKET